MNSPSNESVRAALAEHGIPKNQADKLLRIRQQMESGSFQNSRGEAVTTPEKIQAALDKISDQVKNRLDGFEGKQGELQASVQNALQAIAKLDTEGVHIRGGFMGPTIGNTAAQAFGENADFCAASSDVKRGSNPGPLEARVNVDGSIRAALVNENGFGEGSGDTTYPSQPERRGPVGPVLAPLRLIDALPSRPVTKDSTEFVQITATGEAAPQSYEGAEKAEIDFEGDLQTAKVITIAGHTTASVQVLADVPALQQVIDRTLRHKTMDMLETQLMNGSGVGQNIEGLMVQAASITPTIATTPADAYGEVMVRMTDAGYSPNLAIMNPLDWFRLLLTRKEAGSEEYVFGSPTMPIPPSLWNTRIVLTNKLAQGNGLVLDTSWVTVLDREQASVVLSRSHKDYMTRNLVLIRAELRAGLEVTDQNALRKFTLPAPASV